MTVFLCGFMGCGKTTVGKIAAKKLGCTFCDTDDMIVDDQKMSIPDIFAQKGEPYFRKRLSVGSSERDKLRVLR